MTAIRGKRKTKSAFHITRNVLEIIMNALFLTVWCVTMSTPYLSPRISQVPAFLNLGFPILLLGFLILWFSYLVRRRWKYFAMYSVVGLCSSGFIFTSFPIHLGGDLRSERDLRIMTYNVAGFGMNGDEKNLSPVDFIKAYDADIVCLQEGGVYFDRKKDRAFLRKSFGKKYQHIQSNPILRLTLMTNYKILKSEEVKYPSQTNGTWMYLLEMPDDRTILVINNHMESYALAHHEKEKFRDYLTEFSLEQLPEQTLEVKRRLGPMLNRRAYAAERVKEQVRRYKEEYHPNYIVVLGDLNDIPMSYTYKQLRDDRRDAFADCGFGLGISFNERLMPFRIDHLFYEGGMKAIGCAIPKNKKASDHNPLIVDFEFTHK